MAARSLDRLPEAEVTLAIKAVVNWQGLGLHLGLESEVLEFITQSYAPELQKQMMVIKWLQSDVEATWEKLAGALEKIDMNTIAANIRERFLKTIVECQSQLESEDPIGQELLRSNMEEIQGRFSSLLVTVRQAMESGNIIALDLRQFLVGFFQRDDFLTDSPDIVKIFDRVSVTRLWDYQHYGPLEKVVRHFLPDCELVRDALSNYKGYLSGFFATTKIIDYIKHLQPQHSEGSVKNSSAATLKKYTAVHYQKLKVKLNLNRKLSEVALSYISELWNAFIEEFDLPSLTAVIDQLIEGSLIITWLVSPQVAERIASNIPKAVPFFRQHQIVTVTIDNNKIYDRDVMSEHENRLLEICTKGSSNCDEILSLLDLGVNVDMQDDLGNTALMIACYHGHTKIASILIDHHASINKQNESHLTPLHFASMIGSVKLVETLIKHGAKIEAQAHNGGTPLGFATYSGKVDVIQIFIEHQASVNVKDFHGCTPMHIVAETGNTEVAELLIRHGALTDPPNEDGVTPLWLACRYGNVPLLNILLQHQVNLNSQNKDGLSPLHIACWQGHVHVTEILLKFGAQIDIQNQSGHTALWNASFSGNAQLVKLLTKHGAQVDLQTNDGFSPLGAASFKGHTLVAEVLIQCGALVDIKDNNGSTPLMYASANGKADVVDLFLKNGADSEVQNKDGWTSLHFAIHEGQIEVAQVLIKNGAVVDARGKIGQTALSLASYHGRADMVQMLLSNGANVDQQDDDGISPLHWAILHNHVDVVQVLLENGAPTDSFDKNGVAPIHSAVYLGLDHMVELLINHGAQVDLKMKEPGIGWTALFFAIMNNNIKILDFLSVHGADVSIKDKFGRTAHEVAVADQEMEEFNLMYTYSQPPHSSSLVQDFANLSLMSYVHQQQRSKITNLQTFREVLHADEGQEEDPVYNEMIDHPVHHKHLSQDSVQDTHKQST